MRIDFGCCIAATPDIREHPGGQDCMTTRTSNPEETRFFTDPEGAAGQTRYAEPNNDTPLADAEEEEMAVLWAADPGNQGA
jgi:hypothetical protein